MKNLILVTGVMLVGIGCGKVNDMHDATMKMSSTTEGMAKTTGEMADTTTGMAKKTGDMDHRMTDTYTDMRMASARQAREDALAGLKVSRNIGAKLGYACEYYGSQDFQYWKPWTENEADRLNMMDLAVQEYFHKIYEYISRRDNAAIPPISNESSENLQSMAATMHYINPAQKRAIKGTNAPEVSMLSMIADGLRADRALKAGKITEADIPEYQRQVRIFEQDAIYMLQVRQNFLKGFAYVLMSNQEDGDQRLDFSMRSPLDLAKIVKITNFFKIAGVQYLGKKWTPNFANRNSAQINFYAEVLEYEYETISLLKEIGVEPQGNGMVNLVKLLAGADLKEASKTFAKPTNPAESAKLMAVIRLEKALNTVLKTENEQLK